MPLMDKLLDALKDTPPDTEEDLRQILSDTGYDIIPTEPGGEGEEPDGEGGEEEGPPVFGEEEEEESVETDEEEPEEEGAAKEGMPSPLDALMGGAPEPKTQGMKLSIMRMGAAKTARNKGKTGKKGRR